MPDVLLEKFGHTVRVLRQKKQLSQEELADLCELHRTYISDIELGKRNISLTNINRVAGALNISLSNLFGQMEVTHAQIQ